MWSSAFHMDIDGMQSVRDDELTGNAPAVAEGGWPGVTREARRRGAMLRVAPREPDISAVQRRYSSRIS